MKRVVDHVAAADGPVSREEAAAAAGLTSVQGSLRRIIQRAVAEGFIESRSGVGLLPGPRLKPEAA